MPERIVYSRSGLRAKPLQKEQRIQMRYAYSGDVIFQSLGNRKTEVWSPAKVANISIKGVGLVLDAAMERGTILSVKLGTPGQRFSRPLLLRVVRVVERPPGVWQIGCTFAIPLHEDELSALLRAENASHAAVRTNCPTDVDEQEKLRVGARKASTSGSVFERRCVHRRHLSAEVILSYGPDLQQTLEVLALDGSPGGLKLLSPKPFARGTMLQVRSKREFQTGTAADICIRHCRAQQTMWILGVQFMQPPPSALLLSLGCIEASEA